MKRTYQALNVDVEPLLVDEKDLNTKRMLDLMAVSTDDGPLPLYVHTVYRILREMRLTQQSTGGSFDYNEFSSHIRDAALTPGQLVPLQQRLDTLESFMPKIFRIENGEHGLKPKPKGNDWTAMVCISHLIQARSDLVRQAGSLTIVDLSCPCVTPESACSLFNICLSLFLEQEACHGRVVALDEAHKVGIVRR